jgi:hypothetical protein
MWEKRNVRTLSELFVVILVALILVSIGTLFKLKKPTTIPTVPDATVTELGWCRVLDIGDIPGTEIGFYKVAITDDWKDNLAVRYCFADRQSMATNSYQRRNFEKKYCEVFVFTKTFHQIDKQPFFVLKDAKHLRVESQ